MTQGSARYREMDVLAASPAQRVVLLYTHAVRHLRQAAIHGAQGRPGERLASLGKAHAILEELRYALDPEAGGAVADHLARLYDAWLDVLLRLQRAEDPGALERLTAMVAEMHDAWRQVAETAPAPALRVAV